MRSRNKVTPPFKYPNKAHRRIHGPKGHTSYQAYKPWLRDEFEFRCVYCLTRELWRDDGHNSFTIDHVIPKSLKPTLACIYRNLVYACSRCNTLKSIKLGLPDPCRVSYAKHLRHRSGYFFALTPVGRRMIEYLRLNSKQRVDNRLRYLIIFENIKRLNLTLIRCTFGYPANLPDLSKFKPPKGNSRPTGIAASHFYRHQSGKLPQLY